MYYVLSIPSILFRLFLQTFSSMKGHVFLNTFQSWWYSTRYIECGRYAYGLYIENTCLKWIRGSVATVCKVNSQIFIWIPYVPPLKCVYGSRFVVLCDSLVDPHDDVIKSFSTLLVPCEGWPVDSPHKGQWRGTLRFSLICAWTNGWTNNRDAGDLRRHDAHCDLNVMYQYILWLLIHLRWLQCQWKNPEWYWQIDHTSLLRINEITTNAMLWYIPWNKQA